MTAAGSDLELYRITEKKTYAALFAELNSTRTPLCSEAHVGATVSRTQGQCIFENDPLLITRQLRRNRVRKYANILMSDLLE
jgi:hypothetical protein